MATLCAAAASTASVSHRDTHCTLLYCTLHCCTMHTAGCTEIVCKTVDGDLHIVEREKICAISLYFSDLFAASGVKSPLQLIQCMDDTYCSIL